MYATVKLKEFLSSNRWSRYLLVKQLEDRRAVERCPWSDQPQSMCSVESWISLVISK